jgi:hypothetical protein
LWSGEVHLQLFQTPDSQRHADLTNTDSHWITAYSTPFTRWLVRWRFLFFGLIGLLIILPFNGQWRLGLDSSIYRGVAENIAAGHGYVFAGRPQTLVYPGLPYLLAGFEYLWPGSVIAPLIFNNILALLTLCVIYYLIRSRYPLWIAVVVTCGVGINIKFAQQAQELMADLPFLFAAMIALLGWERQTDAASRRGRIAGGCMLIIGLFTAALLRPTFFIIAAAFAVVAVYRVIRFRERRWIICLCIMAGVILGFALIDPRVRGFNLFHGGYEQQFISGLSMLKQRLDENARPLFAHEMTEAFCNEPLWYFGLPFAVALLCGAVLLTRRQPLWGLQIFILTGVMLVMSDVPRYYVMVLPQLWLGFVLLLLWTTQRCRPWLRDWMLFVLISFVNCFNLSGQLGLWREQHVGEFIESYKRGEYKPLVELAGIIRDRVKPEDVVIGPQSQLVAFLSKRQVLGSKLLDFENAPVSKYPKLVQAAAPKYVVGPANAYAKKDPWMYRLLLKGVVSPGRWWLTTPSGLWIAEANVNVPTGSWKELPTTQPRPVYYRPSKRVFTPEQLARRELRQRKLVKQARIERNKRIERARRADRIERLERKARNQRKQFRQERKNRRLPATLPAADPTQTPAINPATMPTTMSDVTSDSVSCGAYNLFFRPLHKASTDFYIDHRRLIVVVSVTKHGC